MSRIRSALGSIDFKKLRKEADALLKLPAKKREKIQKVLGTYQSKKDLDKFEDQVMKEYEKADRPLTSLDKSRAKGFGISTKNKSNYQIRSEIEDKTAERILKDRASSYEPRFKKRGGKIGNSKMNGNKFVASFYDK